MGNLLDGFDSHAIRRGWEIWQKYANRLSHPKFIFFSEDQNVDGIEICSIYFINKENLLDTLTKNHKLFAQEFGCDFEPQLFLQRMEREPALLKLLNGHEGLLGILLGYGVESSMNYHLRNLIWEQCLPLQYDDSSFKAISSPYLSHDFSSNIHPIAFAGNPESGEVMSIMEQNLLEREALFDLYSSGHFLETGKATNFL